MRLAAEAARLGIQSSYRDMDGNRIEVPESTIRHFLHSLGPHAPPPRPATASGGKCHVPDWLREKRCWGIALQLYELRSGRNWGIGDLADLAAFCRIAGESGADFAGINPLHALFLADPGRCSPFSPSNRRFLNPLYIAVDQVPGHRSTEAERQACDRLRQAELVDMKAVAEIKLAALRKIWRHHRPAIAEPTPELLGHARFEALSLHMRGKGYGAGWKSWPVALHDPDSPQVQALLEELPEEVAFHCWLQEEARRQLGSAAVAARQAGMRIGLYLDLAVGEAPDGSAAWQARGEVVRGVHVGAPPDLFSKDGQDWGLAPLSPPSLAERNGARWRGLLGAVMTDAGAIRIDHAMSLRQQFWIPEGRPAREGGFVSYPETAMIEGLAQLSQERQVMVIGEDLGHVPDGFRETMAAAHILSYRILSFEKGEGGFLSPGQWPVLALACLSTHDLSPLAGWWRGDDIDLRIRHGLTDPALAEQLWQARQAERMQLLQAFVAAEVLADGQARDLLLEQELDEAAFLLLSAAAHRFISRTPSLLASIRLADAVGEFHVTNLPGTTAEYPNWRRRLSLPIEELPHCPAFRVAVQAMAQERPR